MLFLSLSSHTEVVFNGDCPYCQNSIETIDHLFMSCQFLQEIQKTISNNCPILINSKLYFIDWIENIWKYEKTYNRIYSNPLENFFVISWSIWDINSTISRNWKVQPTQVINLVAKTFHELRYYNVVFSILAQDINFYHRKSLK